MKRLLYILLLFFVPLITKGQLVAVVYTDTLICLGSNTIKLPYSTVGTFLSGNVFTAQLSDANGSFASPILIGTDTSITSDTIFCTIPATTPAGSNYRIRVVSSNPIITSGSNGNNIRISPAPEFTLDSEFHACARRKIELSVASADTAISYSWSGPSGYTSIVQSPIINNVSVLHWGIYTVVGSKSGCSVTKNTFLTMDVPPPAPAFTSNSPICLGDTLILSSRWMAAAFSAYIIGPNYIDSTGGSSRQFVPTLADTGVYISYIYDAGDCLGDTAYLHVTINQVFVPTAVIWPMPGNSVNPYTPVTFYSRVYNHYKPRYQWFVNGKPAAGATDTMFTIQNFSSGDKVHLMVYSDTTCTQIVPSDTVTLYIKLGVDDVMHVGRISVYPNPAIDKLSLRLGSNANGPATIELYNTLGQGSMKGIQVVEHGVLSNIDVSSLPSGMYHILVTDEQGNYKGDFIKD
ncbi:MAG: T9SS type A sorting domain-containing protein [Sphingobacteriales bacterium]|nr:MAG: T9SS type A sorting domain-containing protein [Sphingobacteriales bacterium]